MRAPRRSRTPAPGRCSATSIPDTFCVTAETVERALTPATKAVIAGPSVRTGRARRRPAAAARRPRRGDPRGQPRRRPALAVAGSAPGVSATRRRSASFPRRTCSASATEGRSRPNDDERRRARAHPALPRLPGQEHLHRGGLELPPRRAPGGGAARDPGPARRLERPPQGAGRGLRAGGARRAGRRAATRRRTRNPSTICTRSAPRIPMRRRGRWPTPASPRGRTTGFRSTCSPRWRHGPRRTICPARCGLRQTNLALPMGPTLARGHRAPGGRGAARGRSLMRISLQTAAFTRGRSFARPVGQPVNCGRCGRPSPIPSTGTASFS